MKTMELRHLPKLWEGAQPKDDAQALVVAKHYIYQQGYGVMGYEWDGPAWKPEDRYLTNQGYPLGTTCWYVVVTVWGGGREWICEDTFVEAVWKAHLHLAALHAEAE